MAEVRLSKPESGVQQSVECAPDSSFVFEFPTSEATLAKDGDNLNINFEDGSQLNLQGFYAQYNEDNQPTFTIDGVEVAAADFFNAMNEPDLMPAAGPSAGAGGATRGGRYNEYGTGNLASGIDHLNGLDWGMNRAFDYEENLYSVGRDSDLDYGVSGRNPGAINNPVIVNPVRPAPVPPGTTEIPVNPAFPTPPPASGSSPEAARDVLTAREADLAHGKPSVDGAMSVNAPDGVATIVVGGVIVWENGSIVEGAEIRTDEGVLNNFHYDPDTGELTYTFTLEQSTQEHDKPGQDNISHSIPVTVTDPDGDSDTKFITIVIEDDVPIAVADEASVIAGQTVSNNVLDGVDGKGKDSHGQDGPGAFNENGKFDPNGSVLVRWDVPEGSERQYDEDGRGYFEVVTPQGVAKLYDDGDYEFTASKDALRPGENGQVEFSYSIVDQDGDISSTTLTINTSRPNNTPGITPQPSYPDPDVPSDPNDPDKPTDGDDPNNPDRPGDPENPDDPDKPAGGDDPKDPEDPDNPNDPGKPGDRDPVEPDSDGSRVIVDEAALGSGGSGDTVHGATGKGSFEVNLYGENGSVTLTFTSADGTVQTSSFELVNNNAGQTVFSPAAFTLANGVQIILTNAVQGTEDGPWTINFNYALTGAQQHDNPNAVGAADSINSVIKIDVVDETGDRDSSQITVTVHDDGPQFALEAAGANVNLDGSFDLNFGADQAALTGSLTAQGALSTSVNGNATTFAFADGTLTIIDQGNGSFNYAFAPLDPNTTFSKDIVLTATDRDGDTDQLVLTVGYNHKPDITPEDPGSDPDPNPDPTPDPDDPTQPAVSIGNLVVDEGALPNGAGGHIEHDFKGTQSFTVDLHGEDGTIVIGSGTNQATVSITDGKAAITDASVSINGIAIAITDATLVDGKWQISFDYELKEAQSHKDPSASGADDVLRGHLPVTVTDQDGSTANAVLNVTIHDDAPRFEVETTGSKESLEGEFNLSFGGDKAATNGALMADGATKTTVDGARTIFEFPDGVLTVTDNGDGSFSYEFDNLGQTMSKEITLIAKDSDGDTDRIVITVGKNHTPDIIPDPGPDPDPNPDPTPDPDDPTQPAISVGNVIVDEGALADIGSGEHADHPVSGKGSFVVDLHGENGHVIIGAGANSAAVIMTNGSATVAGAPLSVNGVTITVTGAKLVNGKWEISYDYALSGRQEHAKPDASGAEDALRGHLTIIATDQDGSTANAVLNVTVHDDAPHFGSATAGENVYMEGSFTLKYGADLAASADALVADGAIETNVDDNQIVFTFADGTLTLTKGEGDAYDYAFEPNDPDKLFVKDIQLTAKDSDGDTDVIVITVGNNHKPVITPDPDPKPEDPDPTPDPDNENPAVTADRITLDEGNQPQHGGTAHGPKAGDSSFTVNLHGEDGTITIGGSVVLTVKDGVAQPASGASSITSANGVTLSNFILEEGEGGKWIVNYHYNFGQTNITHDKATNDQNVQSVIDVLVVDSVNADKAHGQIVINVHDDAPQFSADAAGSTTTVTGSFSLSYGADQAATSGALTIDGKEPTVADGKLIFAFDDGTLELTDKGNGAFEYNFISSTPNLTFDKTFTLVAKDSDGDIDKIDITVGQNFDPSITPEEPGTDPDPDPNPPSKPAVSVGNVVVDEGALEPTGSGSHAVHKPSGSGSFEVDLHGETGSITVSDGTKTAAVVITDGRNGIASVSGDVLTVNGVEIVIKGAALVNDKWIVSYDYKLTGNQDHPLDDKTGADDALRGHLTITATDQDNVTASAILNVTVHDDGPVISSLNVADSNTDSEGTYVSDSAETITINSNSYSFGADKDDGATLEVTVVDQAEGGQTYKATFTMVEGELVHSGSPSISLNDKGDIVFSRPEEHYKPANPDDAANDSYKFTVTVTDSDGDSVSKDITVGTNFTPDILTPDDPKTPEDDSEVVDEGASIAGAEINVNEAMLADGGTAKGGGSFWQTGTFRLDTHNEGGTVKFSVVDSNDITNYITFKLDSSDSATGSQTLNTGFGTFEITGIQNGVVSYKYTLTKPDTTVGDNKQNVHEAEKIMVELTDSVHKDVTEAYISVNIKDDMPVVETMTYERLDSPEITYGTKLNFAFDDISGVKTSVKDFRDHELNVVTSKRPGNGNSNTGLNHSSNPQDVDDAYVLNQNGYEIIATYVRYTYINEQLTIDMQDNVHYEWNAALADQKNNPTALGREILANKILGISKDGLTIGNKETGSNKYNGALQQYDADELSVINGNMSEAVTFENKNKDISFGLDIEFGKLEANETVVVGFYLTPTNNNDDSLVKLVQAVKGVNDPNGTYKWNGDMLQINVPDGYTKVIVSAAPNNSGDTATGFTIKSFQSFSYAQKYEGDLEYMAGADGQAAKDGVSWNWDGCIKTGDFVEIYDIGYGGKYKVKVTKDSDDVKVIINSGALKDQVLFEGHLDQDGHWEISQNYKFQLYDAKNNLVDAKFNVLFSVKDTEGDSTSHPFEVDLSNPVNLQRFDKMTDGSWNTAWGTDSSNDNAFDVIAGNQLNDLIYGRGGSDILFGDGEKAAFDAMAGQLNLTDLTYKAPSTSLGAGVKHNEAMYNRVSAAFENIDKDGLEKLQDAVEAAKPGQHGDDGLFGGVGDDILFGGAGNDFLSGNGKIPSGMTGSGFTDRDILLGGSGNDIIVYDYNDKIIDGGRDDDILLAGKDAKLTLKQMLENKSGGARVYNIEVLIKSIETNNIEKYGITSHASLLLNGIALGEGILKLDEKVWVPNGTIDGNLSYKNTAGTLVIETTFDNDHVQLVPRDELGKTEAKEDGVSVHDDLIPVDDFGIDLQSDDGSFFAHGRQGGFSDFGDDLPQMPEGLELRLASAESVILGQEDQDAIIGTGGDDVIIGTSGDDVIIGGEGSDIIFAGSGNDMIVYDQSDFLIDGGSGIDFLITDDANPNTLADMLDNWASNGANGDMPMVHDVEVMLKGVDTSSLSNLEALGKEYGLTISKDETTGRDTLSLDKDKWKATEKKEGDATTVYRNTENENITLETTLQEDPSSSADQIMLVVAAQQMHSDSGGI